MKTFRTSGPQRNRAEMSARFGKKAPLYRLIPTKADLFEGMMVGYLDRFVSRIATDGEFQGDFRSALEKLLVDCAVFTLDEEVIGLSRLVASESDRFPELAKAFYEKG